MLGSAWNSCHVNGSNGSYVQPMNGQYQPQLLQLQPHYPASAVMVQYAPGKLLACLLIPKIVYATKSRSLSTEKETKNISMILNQIFYFIFFYLFLLVRLK